MIFDKLHDMELDEMAVKTREDIISQPKQKEEIRLEKVRELIEIQEDSWDKIKWSFICNFRNFDKLLLNIHYKRQSFFSPQQHEIILKFLTIGYLLSDDVRYFNEFLWFNDAPDHPLMNLNLYHFRDNLIEGKYHKFPLASRAEVEKWVLDVKSKVDNAKMQKKSIKIALLGIPSGFTDLYKHLIEIEINPKIFYFPTHANPIKRFVGSNRLLSKLFFYLRRCYLSYTIINNHPRDEKIKERLDPYNLDIAIHRLSFIIKNNIIKAFSVGILNDHLAMLPYVRGLSSVEYSLLFGFPVGSTVHLVDEGVDTGGIISIYTYPIDPSHLSVKKFKRDIIEQSDHRFIKTVKYMMERDYEIVNNPYESGLQYFAIHPELIEFIDHAILS